MGCLGQREKKPWQKHCGRPRVINWTGHNGADQKALSLSLRDTNDWILLSLVGKESQSTDDAFSRYSPKAMTKKGKAFMKRKWWLPGLGDNE